MEQTHDVRKFRFAVEISCPFKDVKPELIKMSLDNVFRHSFPLIPINVNVEKFLELDVRPGAEPLTLILEDCPA